MTHIYIAGLPETKIARARNKCNCCGGGIFKDESYTLIILWDQCKHYINRRKISMNEQVKVCLKCLPVLLHLKDMHQIRVSARVEKAIHKLLEKEAYRQKTRYDIVLETDLKKKLVKTFNELFPDGRIIKPALQGNMRN